MSTNRYSNGSVSRFNPMSFQEVMFAPSMMRQKHDGSIAAAEAMRLKTDPLDVHYNRALQLKQEMDNKISSEVDKINQEGFNPNTTQNITRLNREYQDLIAPTGEVGKINAAKQVYAANLKEYIEDATKNKGWSREDALYNWQNKFANQYTGFGKDGKSIENIGQYGAPKKVEIMEKLKDTKALLGEQVVNEIQASGYGFAPGPDGSMIMVDRSGRRIETSNKPNLAHALNLLKQQFNEKEWSSSREFGRENEGSVMNQVVSGVNAMLKTGVVDNRGERAQYIAGKENQNLEGNLDAVNVEGVSVTRNADLLSKLNSKPSNIPTGYSGGTGGASAQGKPNKEGDALVNETLNSQEYLKLAKGIARTQGIKSDLKSKEVQDAVKKYLTENKDVTVQNRYVDANSKPSDLLFASKENVKDKNAASNSLKERVMTGAYDMVDEEGNVIDGKSIGNHKVVYNGDMSAKSVVRNSKNKQPLFNNPKQNIGLRRASLIDKDGNSKIVYISRGSDDFDTPQFKALEVISGISKIADTQPGIYHEIKSPLFDAYGMKKVEIKYNKNKGTYDMSYTNSEGSKVDANNIPDEVFQSNILNDYNNLYK